MSDNTIPQKDIVLNTLQKIVPDRACIEIRGQNRENSKIWWSGYFDKNHLSLLADKAVIMDSVSKGVYIILNSINPELLNRRINRIDNYTEKNSLTTDNDITKWDYLPIDIDPQRPAGVSSSQPELDLAYERAIEIADYLTLNGFSEPLIACSGNGWHLLYKTDYSRSEENDTIVKNILDILSYKFDTIPRYYDNGAEIPCIKVGVDKSNNNPSRIFKLYGNMARKGDSSETRPHRMSYIKE